MHNRRASTSISGWINGFIGVAIFSGSLPATRIAVQEFDPFFLTFCRGAIAGVLALGLIWLLRLPRPQAGQWRSLALVAGGVVIGFPLLTALALQRVTSAHSIVFIGLLPLATAIFAVIRGGERPRPAFWGFSLLGSVLVATFALAGNAGISVAGDLLMLAAVVVCGLGYAEGGRLTRELGGLAVICWALLLVPTPDVDSLRLNASRQLQWYQCVCMDGAGLCLVIQHAGRLYLLVSGTGNRRYCGGRSTPAIAALFRPGAGGAAPS